MKRGSDRWDHWIRFGTFAWFLVFLSPAIGTAADDDGEEPPATGTAVSAGPAASAVGAAIPGAPDKPWPVPVPGWKPVASGEHPRLVFRKDDLPTLRKRAERPEGQVILQRLQNELKNPVFSTWHAAGYAFLYQITGEAAHAQKAWQMMQMTFDGQGNPDGRYTWPGDGQLRAGPCIMGLGLAYDMVYDGLDAGSRKAAATAIMKNPHFEAIANRPRHCPGCNHWGAHTGGLGVALLGLRGDPEVDAAKIEDLLAKVVHNAKREIVQGYGKRGYYYEGHHCGRLSSNTGLIPFIQAYRVAAGQDLVANCDNARWLTFKWVYEFVDEGTNYAYNSRGMYRRDFDRHGMSSGGDFAHGFGICPEEYKPYVLWLYNRILEPGAKTYDMLSVPFRAPYALANWPFDLAEKCPDGSIPRTLFDEGPGYFVFRNGWKEKGNVVVTALMGSTPGGGRGMARGGSVEVCGHGIRYVLPGMFFTSKPTYRNLRDDGSGVISGIALDGMELKSATGPVPRGITSLAVDFSGASGADLLVAMVGAQVGYNTAYWLDIHKAEVKDATSATGAGYTTKTTRFGADIATGPAAPAIKMAVGAEPEADAESLIPDAPPPKKATPGAPPKPADPNWCVMTMQKGKPPAVTKQGQTVTVGGVTLTFDGEKIVLAR